MIGITDEEVILIDEGDEGAEIILIDEGRRDDRERSAEEDGIRERASGNICFLPG